MVRHIRITSTTRRRISSQLFCDCLFPGSFHTSPVFLFSCPGHRTQTPSSSITMLECRRSSLMLSNILLPWEPVPLASQPRSRVTRQTFISKIPDVNPDISSRIIRSQISWTTSSAQMSVVFETWPHSLLNGISIKRRPVANTTDRSHWLRNREPTHTQHANVR